MKKSEIYPAFGCEICFLAIYTIFRVICFVAIYAFLRGKKWDKNSIGGEKMTNMRYASNFINTTITLAYLWNMEFPMVDQDKEKNQTNQGWHLKLTKIIVMNNYDGKKLL